MRRLTSLAELDDVLKEPGTVLLFKHSTRCPISAEALSEVQASGLDFVYLDLIAHRDVSNAIAERLDVPHESPQAIVLRAGRPAAVLNHFDIERDALSRLMA
jgi:bacillithiol system protein YtxJ